MFNVLNNFETFNEVNDAYLKVNNKSNLFYIINGEENYIAWQKIDSISLYSKSIIELDRSYYDVINGNKVLSTMEYRVIDDDYSNKNKNILLLSDVLNVKPDEEMFLSYGNVKDIIASSKKKNYKTKILHK